MNTNGPLSGKRILITRGGKEGERLAAQIEALGGKAFVVPMIAFRAYEDPNAHEYLKKLPEYDWAVFTSKNGVQYFLEQCSKSGISCDRLYINWAAVGKKTAAYMDKCGLKASFTPSKYTAKDFAAAFLSSGHSLKRVLLPKGNLASSEIADSLKKSGIIVDEWIVYETYLPPESREKLLEVLKWENIDFALFASPSAFRHFKAVIDASGIDHAAQRIKMAAIGPVTKSAVEEAGFTVQVSPDEYTMPAMLSALCQYVTRV
ncbi:uroporphyrinogen-III synthase [Weizmannia acidilactici]|uniref:Uroporphyrinogen-III synthase n=1 Tax=Weizmannia acidilactici TaxID=2607726 RepID=A0A5J4JFA3_9BACI|nr:uroporphyrinogen-III synthase [Weizmannia acidilactici]GER66166.1 uroporphyrinogen-III synthase [Weizmannia acidilactici]GER69197.1 uroporphyrinogen-III synthase [Weizmannia acidilactici]GER72106.1 uroporphyrinogen-III synthase [Weizmannia acidilactici]